MKVRFEKIISSDDKYSCCCSDSIMATCKIDHTGDYRSASDYEALEAKLADTLEMQKLIDQQYKRLIDLKSNIARLVDAADIFADVHYGDNDELGVAARELRAAIDAVKGR